MPFHNVLVEGGDVLDRAVLVDVAAGIGLGARLTLCTLCSKVHNVSLTPLCGLRSVTPLCGRLKWVATGLWPLRILSGLGSRTDTGFRSSSTLPQSFVA
jgi:hypothetical protein